MSDMTWDELVGSMRAVIIAVSDALPERDIGSAWELVDAGEPGIALENLCTQLYEYDITVKPALFQQIRDLAIANESGSCDPSRRPRIVRFGEGLNLFHSST